MRQHLVISLVVALAGVLLLAGCTTTDSAAVKRSLYVDAHPELSEMMAEAILSGQIMIGMTTEMVEAAWGKPSRVEQVDTDEAVLHWIYGNYFVGGNITNLFFDPETKLVKYEVNYSPTHANSGSFSTKGEDEVTRGRLSGSDVLLTKDSGTGP